MYKSFPLTPFKKLEKIFPHSSFGMREFDFLFYQIFTNRNTVFGEINVTIFDRNIEKMCFRIFTMRDTLNFHFAVRTFLE